VLTKQNQINMIILYIFYTGNDSYFSQKRFSYANFQTSTIQSKKKWYFIIRTVINLPGEGKIHMGWFIVGNRYLQK